MKSLELEEIKCKTCKHFSYVDPKFLSNPVVLHCTFCTSRLNVGSRVKVTIE